MNSLKKFILLASMVGICVLVFHLAVQPGFAGSGHEKVAADDHTSAVNAFESMVTVLHSPRCMNCHSKGDFPRQGDDEHQHTMDVRRGTHGDGVAGVHCSACHQERNSPGQHTPPGAPNWHLPSADMPMIWEGASDQALCELLKDPKQNGNRTPNQIVEHLTTPLVRWGWSPGEGRTPIATPYNEFLANAKTWALDGAECPK